MEESFSFHSMDKLLFINLRLNIILRAFAPSIKNLVFWPMG